MYDTTAIRTEKEKAVRDAFSRLPPHLSHCLLLPSLTMMDLRILAETGRVDKTTRFVFVDDVRYSGCPSIAERNRLLRTVSSAVQSLGLSTDLCSYHLYDLSMMDASWYCSLAGAPFDFAFFDFCGPLQDRTCKWLSRYSSCFVGPVMFTFGVSSQNSRASWRHSCSPDTRGMDEASTCSCLLSSVERWMGCEILSSSVYSDSRERMCLMRGWAHGRQSTDEGLKSVFERRTARCASSRYPAFYREQLMKEPCRSSRFDSSACRERARSLPVGQLLKAWESCGGLSPLTGAGYASMRRSLPWLPSSPSRGGREAVMAMFSSCSGMSCGRMVCSGLGFRKLSLPDILPDPLMLQRAKDAGIDTRPLESLLSVYSEDCKSLFR